MYNFNKLLYSIIPHKASRNQNKNNNPEVRIPYFLLYVTKILVLSYKRINRITLLQYIFSNFFKNL